MKEAKLVTSTFSYEGIKHQKENKNTEFHTGILNLFRMKCHGNNLLGVNQELEVSGQLLLEVVSPL